MRLWPRLLIIGALLQPAPAVGGLSPDAYTWVVNLVESLYLKQERVDAPALIKAAAGGLADRVHWLIVETEGDVLYLRHGNGTKLGSLSVTSMEGLPKGLQTLEEMVVGSGYSVGDVDVRLAILKGMTSALDRYSTILSGDRLDRFDVRLKGTTVSIGATTELRDEVMVVATLDAQGSAHRSGLKEGDEITRIDGVSTVNMPVREAERRLRGEAGTQVSLHVRRAGEVLTLSIAREEVIVPNVKHRVLDGNVGYVQITHFSQKTTDNLRTALRALKSLGALDHGLVIDLRGNTGGSMKDSARSADLFIEQGMLLRTAGHDGRSVQNLQERMDARLEDEAPDVPLVVLSNHRTASGSEILAGALLQLDRAAMVGGRSFGKGTVQKVYRIDNARLKLTVARYLLHGDRQITEDGLVPDLALADVRLDSNGMRYKGWSDKTTGASRHDVVPVVLEHSTWRGERTTTKDMRIEVARRAVSRAKGPSRQAVLQSLTIAAEQVRAEQEAMLVDALASRDIDWTTDLPPSDTPPDASVRVRAAADPDTEAGFVVTVQVSNQGAQDLEQAVVELNCATYKPWNGLAVPLGRVKAGETATGEVRMRLYPGVSPRQDVVSPVLRVAGRPERTYTDAILQAGSEPRPRIAITARLLPGDRSRRAQITVQNLTAEAIDGVEIAFEHPGDVGVELIDHAARTPRINARGSARFDLDLRVTSDASGQIPLKLDVRADNFNKPLAEWPLDLPLDGTVVVREPPRIDTSSVPLAASMGPLNLAITVKDETRLDHAVAYANGQKIAWAAGGKAELTLMAPIELTGGQNNLVIVAVDEHGLHTRRSLRIHGEETAVADEQPTEP